MPKKATTADFIDVMFQNAKDRNTAFSLIHRAAQSKMKEQGISIVAHRFSFRESAVKKWYDRELIRRRKK